MTVTVCVISLAYIITTLPLSVWYIYAFSTRHFIEQVSDSTTEDGTILFANIVSLTMHYLSVEHVNVLLKGLCVKHGLIWVSIFYLTVYRDHKQKFPPLALR